MDCLGRTLARALSMVALTVLVAGTYATLVASPAAAQVVIVSAGDSYASGEGAADGSPSAFPVWRGDDTDGLAQPCHRSTLAGAAVAAAQLGGYKPVAFASVACTGSVTGATPPGGGSQGSGPQSLLGSGGQFATIKSRFGGTPIDALTLSIGGNDIGFSSIVKACLDPATFCEIDPILTSLTSMLLADLPRRLDEVFAAVNSGAAGTIRFVVVTEYPDPTIGLWGLRCGNPVVPGFAGFDGISEDEATWASIAVIAPLNAAIQDAVFRANTAPGSHPAWAFVSGISSRFSTHGYCTDFPSPSWWTWGNPRYVNTLLDSITAQGDPFGSMHPNASGHAEIADALYSAVWFLVAPQTPEPAPRDPVICFDTYFKKRVPCNED